VSDPSIIEDNRLLPRIHVLQLHRNKGVACYFLVIGGDPAHKSCVVRELSLYLKFIEADPSGSDESDSKMMMNILQAIK
jgi:hypothetical protein